MSDQWKNAANGTVGQRIIARYHVIQAEAWRRIYSIPGFVMPSPTLAAPVRVFCKIRNTVTGTTIESRLQAAVSNVQGLEAERQRIIQECAAKIDISRFSEITARAQKLFSETGSIQDESALIVAQLVEQEATRRVAPMVFAKQRGYLEGQEWATFANQFPEWKNSLRTACQFSLEVAKEQHEKVSAGVKAELGGQFDEEDLLSDLRVKRARNQVEIYEGAVKRCGEVGDGELLWRSLVGKFCQEHE
jgi:hypothetical protein